MGKTTYTDTSSKKTYDYDSLIDLINNFEMNINELPYEVKMDLMQYSYNLTKNM